MDSLQIITLEDGKRGGKPRVRATRITAGDVVEYLASGVTAALI